MIGIVMLTGALFLAWSSPASTSALSLRITIDKEALRIGEHPIVQAYITNGGSRPVTLVKPGDGSEVGWRTPEIGWSIATDNKPKTDFDYRQLRFCGNINPLEWHEVFILYPGQTREVSEWLSLPPLLQAGTYKVSCTYSNLPQREWQGVPLGINNPLAMVRVRLSTSCTLESNELSIEVN